MADDVFSNDISSGVKSKDDASAEINEKPKNSSDSEIPPAEQQHGDTNEESEEEVYNLTNLLNTEPILENTKKNDDENYTNNEEVDVVKVDKIKEEEDTRLKQNDSGTLLSRGGEFQPDDAENVNTNDSALNRLQTTSDIRFFICGTCKNNPILIGSTPKLLPCLHSFCEGCLKERYEKQRKGLDGSQVPRLKCPSCGQEFLVAGNDRPTSGFLNNQFVIESTPTAGPNESENHQCTSCDDKSSANSYCMNCNEWLCDACVNAHQRVKVTKDHIIQAKSSCNGSPILTVLDSGVVKEKPLFCKVHPREQLKLFCANCDKLTCRDCQLVEHKDHRYQFIEEAASKHREILKKLLQYLQINLGLLKETIVDVEKVSTGLGDQEVELEEQITKAFGCLISSIKAREQMLIKELKTLVLNKQTLLAKQKKDLTQMRIILEHNHDFAEFAVKGGSNVALLYSRKVLGTRLHNLNSLKYRQRPLAFTDLKFSMDVDKLCSYFSKIGAVYSHEDMKRKIDHYNTKTSTNSNVPRTMALSSRTFPNNKTLNARSPIESMTAINKRISDSTAITSSTTYINLSKQGSLGLPGHQIRSAAASPISSYNINSRRLPSSSNQDMIVLSSSHVKSFPNTDAGHLKKDIASKYLQFKDYSNRNLKPTSHVQPSFHQASPMSNRAEYPQSSSVSTPYKETSNANWSKIEQTLNNNKSSRNSTIDQLRKMVEGTAGLSHTDCTERSTSDRSNNSDPGPTQSGRLSANGMVLVKQEGSPDGTQGQYVMTTQQDVDIRSESGFDESQSNEDYCGVCRNGGQLLCCDTCPKVYHLHCHVPALTDLPSDSWSCGLCLDIGTDNSASASSGQKRRFSERLSEWELKVCEKILLQLFVHHDSLPFHHKVSKTQVPDYCKVIQNPMDLMTVLTKLNPQHFQSYKTIEEAISDMRLIFSNCFIYNSPDSDVCKMGHRLEAHFDQLLQKFAHGVNTHPENEGLKWKRRKEENPLFTKL